MAACKPVPSDAAEAAGAVCLERPVMAAILGEDLGQVAVAWREVPGAVEEIWVSPATGFTLVRHERATGLSCALAWGDDWSAALVLIGAGERA